MSAIRSRVYDCFVFHSRTEPVLHQFTYRYFTFCLDLDEIEKLANKSRLFGMGRLKPFRFVAKDSLFGENGNAPQDVKYSVIDYAKKMGIAATINRVEVLAHVRTMGYSYNPAAIFFGYDHEDNLLFGIVEVTNTFREKKAYFIQAKKNSSHEAFSEAPKLFYVSPFVELDTQFEFHLTRPTDQLFVRIDSNKKSSTPNTLCVVSATLKGKSRPITDSILLLYLFKFPFLTLSVMYKIHFQAARLYFKRVPFIKKTDHPELQKGGFA